MNNFILSFYNSIEPAIISRLPIYTQYTLHNTQY